MQLFKWELQITTWQSMIIYLYYDQNEHITLDRT